MDLVAARSHLRCKHRRAEAKLPHSPLGLDRKDLFGRPCFDFLELPKLLEQRVQCGTFVLVHARFSQAALRSRATSKSAFLVRCESFLKPWKQHHRTPVDDEHDAVLDFVVRAPSLTQSVTQAVDQRFADRPSALHRPKIRTNCLARLRWDLVSQPVPHRLVARVCLEKDATENHSLHVCGRRFRPNRHGQACTIFRTTPQVCDAQAARCNPRRPRRARGPRLERRSARAGCSGRIRRWVVSAQSKRRPSSTRSGTPHRSCRRPRHRRRCSIRTSSPSSR